MADRIVHNLTLPTSYKVGTSQVAKIYLGTTLLWVNEHSLSVSPTSIVTSRSNGAYNPSVTVTVTGGVGSFTYSWAWFAGGAGMTLSNATTATVTINSNGTDEEMSGTLRCTVTDTGNGSLVKTIDVNVVITFGTPP